MIDEAGRRSPEVAAMAGELRSLAVPADDAARIDLIGELEALRSAVAAAQARVTAAFVESQCAQQQAAGVAPELVGRGVAAQVALARHVSPHAAQRYVAWARMLTTELPQTLDALRAGRTSEWRAMLLAREAGWLSPRHRAEVDRDLGPRLGPLGDRQVANEARRLTQRLDQAGAVENLRHAERERRVTIRPAPDTMCWLTALLPVAQGVAAYAALTKQAAGQVGVGSETRGRGQLMADTLVERLTGQSTAADVPIEVQLVMSQAALLGRGGEPGRDEPAQLAGFGPIPAPIARRLIHGRSPRTPTWLRRVYAAPHSGELVAMDSRRRAFTAGQRRFVRLRDQFCRTPWCGAPIRHTDHVAAHAAGGPTSISNAQGLCQACNHAKQAPGWRAETVGSGYSPDVITSTPTGHTYRSRAPDFMGPAREIRVEMPPHRAA